MGRRVRAREFGIEIGVMKPGRLNSITDVEGVGVGHTTIIRGEGPLRVGEGPVRAGVTAIVPHQGNPYEERVTAAVDLFNAFGKSTGLPQVMHMGVLETPILLTDTLNTWLVADAVLDYFRERYGLTPRTLNPVVGETNGGFLNDSYGRHVRKEHVFKAIDMARSPEGRGPVEEGNAGGGTPMIGYGLKGGIGTASRICGPATLGVLVQLNCGRREDLIIDGVPVGRELKAPRPRLGGEGGSIMMVLATDLALDSRQLWKVAKRAALGLARTGSYGGATSGDFTIAFTTGKVSREAYIEALPEAAGSGLGEEFLNPIYKAAVEATEEAILNALFKAETMVGINWNTCYELPLDEVAEIFERYGRKL
jgi:D-aminopeptidase